MRNPDYDYVVSTRARGRVQGRTRGLSKATVKRGIRKEYRDEGVKKVTVRKVKNGLLSNLRMVKAHDKRAIQGAALKGRLEAIDAQIRDVTVDPFYRKEKSLQGLALRRLRERRREIQAQMKKNPQSAKHTCYYCGKLIKGEMKISNRVGYHPACYAKAEREAEKQLRKNPGTTENQAAWRKGYEHGYKGLNSRPDYPKVGLAGSYRLGYEAGEKRRKGKAHPRKNPMSSDLRQAKRDLSKYVTQAERIYARLNKAHGENNAKLVAKLAPEYDRANDNANKAAAWVRRLQDRERKNPKREAKTSKDAFGVTHENHDKDLPSKDLEYGSGQRYDIFVNGQYVESAGEKAAFAARAVQQWRKISKKTDRVTWRIVGTKKNPSVAAIAEKFQGKTDGAIEEFYAASSAPANLARAGKLVFLKAGKVFRLPGAMVAIAPNEKLWIVGKHAPMFETKAKPGERLDVGELTEICYETAKRHIGNGKTFEYHHVFGEDGGKCPHLHIDHEGMPLIVGGDYKIRAEGIVN